MIKPIENQQESTSCSHNRCCSPAILLTELGKLPLDRSTLHQLAIECCTTILGHRDEQWDQCRGFSPSSLLSSSRNVCQMCQHIRSLASIQRCVPEESQQCVEYIRLGRLTRSASLSFTERALSRILGAIF